MAADMFNTSDCRRILHGKNVFLFGDSNMRAIYKDAVWMMESPTLIPTTALRKKNEPSHAKDVLVSDGNLTKSRTYQEVRVYDRHGAFLHFEFLTRLFAQNLIDALQNPVVRPDVVVLNSCLWDLTRWGADGVEEFKKNLAKTLDLFKEKLPQGTRVIWTTTLPPSFKSRGGFLTPGVDFMKTLLPFHVIEANNYAACLVHSYGYDVADLHYHMRFLIDMRSADGIHWEPKPLRYVTNLILTHVCLACDMRLPGNVAIDVAFLNRSHRPVERLGLAQNASRMIQDDCRERIRNDKGRQQKRRYNRNSKCFKNYNFCGRRNFRGKNVDFSKDVFN